MSRLTNLAKWYSFLVPRGLEARKTVALLLAVRGIARFFIPQELSLLGHLPVAIYATVEIILAVLLYATMSCRRCRKGFIVASVACAFCVGYAVDLAPAWPSVLSMLVLALICLEEARAKE
jgi:hypothetical protein